MAHLCWSHWAVGHRRLQIAISNENGNHTQYLTCSYWKYYSILMSWSFSKEDVENYWSVTRYHMKSQMPCSWEQQSYPGDTCASSENDHNKKWPLIARFMGPTWGPSGADMTQVGPMLAPWPLLIGTIPFSVSWDERDAGRWEKICSPHVTEKGTVFVWCRDLPSIIAHVTPG